MEIVGWIVRTGEPGSVQYWKVGIPEPERAAAIAAETAGVQTAKAIARIGARAAKQSGSVFALNSSAAIEIWGRKANLQTHGLLGPDAIGLVSSEDLGQISFDTLLSNDDNVHVEGSYRVDAGDWKVFHFTHHHPEEMLSERNIRHDIVFRGGVIGTNGIFPIEEKLNKSSVAKILSELTGVGCWFDVSGPDSLILK